MADKKQYFLLHSGESHITIQVLSPSELLKTITPDEGGNTYYGPDLHFCTSVPDCDDGYFVNVPDNTILIVYGTIVVPKPEEVVTRYALPETER